MEGHQSIELDLPPVILVERRQIPSRRSSWRGGRRNTDWLNRPIGAWRHLAQPRSLWRQWAAKLALAQGD